ncbi:MAG: PilT/PilU family type 4a pilus ATPase [Lentisphaeria bacterium]|nr:PilT/PilU family type 4a pilus ATPase [Lentisphaeria bacterium]
MLEKLLLKAAEENISDLFIHAGKVPAFRIQGKIKPEGEIISGRDIDLFRKDILSEAGESFYRERGSADCSCTIEGNRFRINFFTTLTGPALAVRPVKKGESAVFSRLNLPEEFLKNLCQEQRGLVLITGSTGSGKSTTLASMIHYINYNFYRHILTLEDPIEYVFTDELSRISQRELSGSEKFADALRSALRENPDVIVIGEMRDLETMQTAVTAAMTGHLVLATVHTSDTVKAVERIVNQFPENIREQASEDIAQSLLAVIAQRLVPSKNGKDMLPAMELLPAVPTVKKLIGERDFASLEEFLKRNTASGMQNFNKAVFDLYRAKHIFQQDAFNAVDNQEEFKLLLKGMETGVETFRASYGADAGNGNFVDMKALLQYAHSFHASDLHLTASSRPILRLNGQLRPLDLPPLTPSDIQQLLFSIISRRQRIILEEKKELDMALSIQLEEGGKNIRYRLNAYYQRGSLGIAVRVVNDVIPPPEELMLPPQIVSLIDKKQGLILVTGPTGSGKSTTLASLIDQINTRTTSHIITIEDPIEYVHSNKSSIVEQRELHADTLTFAAALKYALRQDPDVIMVGEMRDTETIASALTAAETGHLVFATIHTNSAAQTIDRIIDSFPAGQQNQIRQQLAGVLLGVISQRLIPSEAAKKRVGAFEILLGTTPIQALIRENKTHLIRSAIETAAKDGMQTLDKSLQDLYARGLITYADTKQYQLENSLTREY